MRKAITILVVEDDEDMRFALSRFLDKDRRFEITMNFAETGAAGLELFRANDFDCVILDYGLPGMDGLSVLKAIKEIDVETPVIILTGLGSENLAAEVMKLGATDYLPKDRLNNESIQDTLARAIKHGRLLKQVKEQKEDLENFARVLVHDLNSPIAGIIGYAQLLAEEAKSDPSLSDKSDMFDMIHDTASNMHQLIKTLHKYATGSGEFVPEDVKLSDVLQQAQLDLSTVLKASHAELKYPKDMPTIKGSRPQLIQLLGNLINNAVKYCDKEIPNIVISADVDEDMVHIVVADNGEGIKANDLLTIFEPFVRLQTGDNARNRTGTGLGLATCRRIVERHSGKIWCESTIGVGSQFHVVLPLDLTQRVEDLLLLD